MSCAVNLDEDDLSLNTLSINTKPTKSEKGIAYKRPDGQWYVCVGTREPKIEQQKDLMDPRQYFVTPVGSLLNSLELKRQSAKMKRYRKREEAKNQKSAKNVAEKKREDWLKKHT